jgi:hypothetical protein
LDQKAIQAIKAKASRVKLPLNEMAILRWCVVTGGVGGPACVVVGLAMGYLYSVKPEQVIGIMPFAAIFGAMTGGCVAVAIATAIKVTFSLVGRIEDACKTPDPSSGNELLDSPKGAREMVKPDKTATQC